LPEDPAGSILAGYWRSKGKNKIEGTPYKIEGIGQDKLPGTLDMSVIDEYYTVSDKEHSPWHEDLRAKRDSLSADHQGSSLQSRLKIARELMTRMRWL